MSAIIIGNEEILNIDQQLLAVWADNQGGKDLALALYERSVDISRDVFPRMSQWNPITLDQLESDETYKTGELYLQGMRSYLVDDDAIVTKQLWKRAVLKEVSASDPSVWWVRSVNNLVSLSISHYSDPIFLQRKLIKRESLLKDGGLSQLSQEEVLKQIFSKILDKYLPMALKALPVVKDIHEASYHSMIDIFSIFDKVLLISKLEGVDAELKADFILAIQQKEVNVLKAKIQTLEALKSAAMQYIVGNQQVMVSLKTFPAMQEFLAVKQSFEFGKNNVQQLSYTDIFMTQVVEYKSLIQSGYLEIEGIAKMKLKAVIEFDNMIYDQICTQGSEGRTIKIQENSALLKLVDSSQ